MPPKSVTFGGPESKSEPGDEGSRESGFVTSIEGVQDEERTAQDEVSGMEED